MQLSRVGGIVALDVMFTLQAMPLCPNITNKIRQYINGIKVSLWLGLELEPTFGDVTADRLGKCEDAGVWELRDSMVCGRGASCCMMLQFL